MMKGQKMSVKINVIYYTPNFKNLAFFEDVRGSLTLIAPRD